MMGHQMRHQSAEMGHKGTPTDTILTHVDVMVKRKARRGVSAGFPGAERPKNQVWVAEADPTPFCDFRGLWYTSTNKFSAQQGWRHGVRSRSLGGTFYIPSRDCVQLVSRPAGRFSLLLDHAPWAPVTYCRVETWTSYRGKDWENKQGRGWEYKQDRGLDII
jgi:hypothetical protein